MDLFICPWIPEVNSEVRKKKIFTENFDVVSTLKDQPRMEFFPGCINHNIAKQITKCKQNWSLTPLELHHKNDCKSMLTEISSFRGFFTNLMSVHQQKACSAKLQMRTNNDFKPTLSRIRWLGSVVLLVKQMLNTSAKHAKCWGNQFLHPMLGIKSLSGVFCTIKICQLKSCETLDELRHKDDYQNTLLEIGCLSEVFRSTEQ